MPWSTAEYRITTSTTSSSLSSIAVSWTIRASLRLAKFSPLGGCCSTAPAKKKNYGVTTDNCGNDHLVRIQILVVPTIGHNLFSVKTATRNGIVSISDRENPRLEAFGVSLPLRGKQDDSYSFMLDLRADAYSSIELAMNAVSNAQLWHRRLGHLNRRSLELIQRHDGNGITFDGTIPDCDVYAVGKSQKLAHPKKAQHSVITRPFQLCYGDLMGPFTPQARGGFKNVREITDQFTR